MNDHQHLFQYAVLYHPKASKDDVERGVRPKSVLVTEPTTILAGSDKEVAMMAARSIPEEHTEHLEDVEVLVRPF